jgi:hypothetical protein
MDEAPKQWPFQLRMPPWLRQALEEHAYKNNLSLNSEIVDRLVDSLKAQEEFGSVELRRLTKLMDAAFVMGCVERVGEAELGAGTIPFAYGLLAANRAALALVPHTAADVLRLVEALQ